MVRRNLGRKKGTTLYVRLFLFISCICIAIILAIILVLNMTGVFDVGNQRNVDWFSSQYEMLSQQVAVDIGNLTVQGLSLSQVLSTGIAGHLQNNGMVFSDLQKNPAQLVRILEQISPSLLASLRMSKSGGAFIVLDAGTQEGTLSGMFVKRTEPNTVTAIGSKLHLLRGPAQIGRSNGIELLGQWKMEFFRDEVPMFDFVTDNSRQRDSMALSRLYYWTPRMLLAQNSESGILLMVPMIGNDGTVYGVCGFELSSMLFKQSYSPDNSMYPKAMSFLAPILDWKIDMANGLSAGNSYLNSMTNGKVRNVLTTDGLDELMIEGEGKYLGVLGPIQMYSANSLYAKNPWVFGDIAPEEELGTVAKSGMLWLQAGLLLVCLASIVFAALLSKYYISPVVKTFQGIKEGTGYSDLPKTQYQEINDLLEFLATQEEETALALAQANATSQHQDIPQVDEQRYQQFLTSLDTLSKAEQRVFDLYVQEYKAPQIARKLYISINTVKYHNANIYSKLQVGSRKELLDYIRYMRYQQQG